MCGWICGGIFRCVVGFLCGGICGGIFGPISRNGSPLVSDMFFSRQSEVHPLRIAQKLIFSYIFS